MMAKNKILVIGLILFSLFSIALISCSGGGDSAATPPSPPPPSTPQITVLPASFDFGTVTDVNTVAPLEVTIQNTGTGDLALSGISLSDAVNFNLDLNGGTSPCASATTTLQDGESCTMSIDFVPQDVVLPPEGISYSAALTIESNDPTTPTYDLSLAGKRQNITEINVKINQIDACPRVVGTPVKAYVSVTDQGGFPVATLDVADFTLSEAGTNQSVTTTFVNNTVSLSVTMLMDYSFSIRQEPDNVTDMQNAALAFVEQLGNNDEAEIIKYATTIEVTQPFTSDQTLIENAILSTPTLGGETAFFDALIQAIDGISARSKDRKAIIIITDGEDNDGTGNPLSVSTLADIIADAKAVGIPVFTVGLGDRVDPTILSQIADETGGTYSPSITSDNLTTIYQQLASLLFTDQYILTYDTDLDGTQTGDLSVTATYAPGISGTDTKTIPVCN